MPLKKCDYPSTKGLPVLEFNLDSIVKNPSIVIIAKRGSGKSFLCRALLNHFRDIPVGLVISQTDRMSCFYGNFIPKAYVHYAYKTSIIDKLLERQKIMISKNKLRAKNNMPLIDCRSFVVMDDCLSSGKIWMKDFPIKELLFNGRHYEIMYILTMQFPLGITPDLRGNFDYIFIFDDEFVSNLKRIYDHYAGMFPTFDAFRYVFKQLTKDFACMVIVNRGTKNTFQEKVFYYRAPDINDKDIIMGCKQYRKFNQDNYNAKCEDFSNYGTAANAEDIFDKCKKNKSRITVEKIGKT